ncbi:MAG: hypothetical protein ACX939_02770 [Hyphococcus sp.]
MNQANASVVSVTVLRILKKTHGDFSMKSILLAVAASVGLTSSAFAGPYWESFGFQVKSQDAEAVVTATDKFMSSADGQSFSGTLMLLANIANGSDPTTHSYVVLHDSAAEAEAWQASTQNGRAWKTYLNSVTPIMKPTYDGRFRTLKAWGTPNPETKIWHGHMIRTDNPAAVVAALDGWFSSSKGSQFPGEAYLSTPIAAGMSKPTHLISVGFESEAAMEAWTDSLYDDSDYQAFITEISGVTDYLGANLSSVVKAWLPATDGSQ